MMFKKLALLLLLMLAGFRHAHAGPVIIDGTDANDHGGASEGQNRNGWLYMQRVLENLAAQVTPSAVKVVVSLGINPNPMPNNEARDAINSAFTLSSLPGAGWVLVYVDGDQAIDAWLAALATSNTGILYIPTAGHATGDLTASELGVVNMRADEIAAFVGGNGTPAQGGALWAMSEEGPGAWGWLTTLLPGLMPVNGQANTDITLTPDGMVAFPGLTNADLAGADPWHTYFDGDLGSLRVLGVAPLDGEITPRNVILGGGAGTEIVPCDLTCPSDITVSNDPGQCGAVVNYTPPTVDERCGTVNCNPPPGAVFPVGSTTVTCTVTPPSPEPDGEVEPPPPCSFRVIVNDLEPPRIACPQDLTVTAPAGACMATNIYTLPTAADNCQDPPPGVTCAPPPGGPFPIGSQLITCVATDAAGNTARCSFSVTIRGNAAPQLSCPTEPITVNAQGACTARMPDLNLDSRITARDVCAPGVRLPITQSIAPGTQLSSGMQSVTVTAISGGMTATCTVTINVTNLGVGTLTVSPGEVNLSTVELFARKKKKKARPAVATGTFTLAVTGADCAALAVNFRAINRVTDSGRVNPDDDTRFFSVFDAAGNELIGRNRPTGGPFTLNPGTAATFTVRFDPTVPAVRPCKDSSCLRAFDVAPEALTSELVLELPGGQMRTVRLNARVRDGVTLINPANGQTASPAVSFCKTGDEFIVRYHVYDADLSDVRSASIEFLNSGGSVVAAFGNVDLAGPLGQSGLTNGQSFSIEHAYTGAESNPEVTTVRVTVRGANSSDASGDVAINSNCGASLQALARRSTTLRLPAVRLGALKQ